MTTKAFQQIDDLQYSEWDEVPAAKWKTLMPDEAARLQRELETYSITAPGDIGAAGGPLAYWESLQGGPPAPARVEGSRKKARPDRAPRIARGEDVREVLVELVTWAMADPAIRPNDLTVLRALADNGIGRTSIEIEASRDWLAEVTGLTVEQVRWATGRLDRLGYVRRITRAQVTRQWLKSYLARHPKDGRPPNLYRLSTDLPNWQAVPTGPPILGGLDELLAASR